MKLDRQLQLELMQKMASTYPSPYDFEHDLHAMSEEQQSAIMTNLYYLQSHGLLEEKSVIISRSLDFDTPMILNTTRLSHKGMDFLADDGGLSAILNVVTVKFEADTLKAILESKINDSDLSSEEKNSMIDALRELPAESIKHLTTTLLDKGIESLPSVMLLIGTYLGLFS